MRKLFLGLIGAVVFSSLQTVPVAGKIMEFCKSNMGKKVDRGECWDLANMALNYAGADWTGGFNFGDKIDYKKENLKPADILQFTNVKFMFPNRSMSFPKHTAIVSKAEGGKILVYHQNFNNKRSVDTLTINLENIKNGKIEAYRPKGKSM
ncbi:MAG: CHAP domain-containing protein [Bacteroidia bacterium]|nr:CHAP domain-containing protein [Bacteroidia bacterium]